MEVEVKVEARCFIVAPREEVVNARAAGAMSRPRIMLFTRILLLKKGRYLIFEEAATTIGWLDAIRER